MRKALATLVKALAWVTAVALMMRLFVFENFRVLTSSMEPNIKEGEFLLISKIDFNLRLPFTSYEIVRFRAPRRSEVVAFVLPERGPSALVKRVVGIAGDKVAIRGGKLFLNDRVAQYDPAPGSADGRHVASDSTRLWEIPSGDPRYRILRSQNESMDYGPVVVPPDHCFVLGDNRNDRTDSRLWGPIPYSSLRGRGRWTWLGSAEDKRLWNSLD